MSTRFPRACLRVTEIDESCDFLSYVTNTTHAIGIQMCCISNVYRRLIFSETIRILKTDFLNFSSSLVEIDLSKFLIC